MAQRTRRLGLRHNGLEWYRTMRDTDPVWWDPGTGTWNIFRYQDAAALLADYQTFSSDFRQFMPETASVTAGNILATDPPYHQRLRNLISQAFTPRAIARLEPHIEELTETLLDRAAARGELELVSDL